jgi:hypothetical protein
MSSAGLTEDLRDLCSRMGNFRLTPDETDSDPLNVAAAAPSPSTTPEAALEELTHLARAEGHATVCDWVRSKRKARQV